MKPDCKKITQVINYLANHQSNDGDSVPELKIIKLIWAADRFHLRKYARTVTYDNYVAMMKGPVGSTTKNVAEFETNFGDVDEKDLQYSKNYIKFHQDNNEGYISAIAETDTDELSETDIEALNFALNSFGNMETQEIINFTHQYPEWKKHEEVLIIGKKVEPIDMLDFFKNPPNIDNDPFGMSEEILSNSKEIYKEYI